MKYLLDTCIIETLLKEEPGHQNIRARIAAAPRGSLAISALTTVEIWKVERWGKVIRKTGATAD